MDTIALILSIIGSLNWGLVGIFQFDLVAWLFGSSAALGSRMKTESPFATTFVISCCNGANGYLPTNKAFDYGCYESFTGRFARGTGDRVADTLVSMLKEMKK